MFYVYSYYAYYSYYLDDPVAKDVDAGADSVQLVGPRCPSATDVPPTLHQLDLCEEPPLQVILDVGVLKRSWTWDLGDPGTLWTFGPWRPLDLLDLGIGTSEILGCETSETLELWTLETMGPFGPWDPLELWTFGAHVDLKSYTVLEDHGQVVDPHDGAGFTSCAKAVART